MEPYSAVLVLDVPEAAAGAFDLFDEPVDAFGLGLGDAGVDERLDMRPPRLDRRGSSAIWVAAHQA